MALTTGDILAIVLGSILGIIILGYIVYISVFRKRSVASINQVENFIKKNPQYRDTIVNYIRQIDQEKKKGDSTLSGEVTVSKTPKDQELNQVFKDSQTTPVR